MKRFMLFALLTVMAVVAADKPADSGKQLRRGLVAHYFADPRNWDGNWPDDVSVPKVDPSAWTFREYGYSRVEPLINHQFIRRGWFSVRWKGVIDPVTGSDRKAGTGQRGDDYVFEIHADDGCRLIVDGRTIIDDWRACWEASPGAIRRSPAVRLDDGPHEIVVEYFQGQSLRKQDRDPMRLYWSSQSGSIPRQVIPASHFRHSAAHAESPQR